MKFGLQREITFQLAALMVSFLLIHAFYTVLVRPAAQEDLAIQAAFLEAGETPEQRSVWVVIKDFEQETCFILMFWALSIMGYKASRNIAEQRMLERELIPLGEGTKILPEDARQLARPIESMPESSQDYLLPRVLLVALQRLATGASIQEISESVRDECETESQRLDSELSMIRYIAWAIPSIGFIGTVRGIGDALANAHKAVEGDIAGVTASLGVAFNSTFIALLISILIMFFSYQLTLHQERLVLQTQRYCDRHLLRKIKG